MATAGISMRELLSITSDKLGIDLNGLKIADVRNMSKRLADVLILARKTADVNFFIEEFKKWANKDDSHIAILAKKNIELKEYRENLIKKIEKEIKSKKKWYVHEQGLYSGIIASGFFMNKEWRHFNSLEQTCYKELFAFIADEIMKEKIYNDDLELDNFINCAMIECNN